MSALAVPMFVRVRVPDAGTGVTVGDWGCTVATLVGDLAVDFWTAAFRCVGEAAKLSTASEMPDRQRKTPSRLRLLMKPDLHEDFFFMEGLGLAL